MHANAFITTAQQVDVVDWGTMRDQVEVEGGYQSLLERDVVVRRLHPSASASPRRRSRFIKEIQTLAALHHHNFVRVYDAGEVDDLPFAVFERLRGATAQQRLDALARRGAHMEIDEAVRIVRGVADGVEYARRRGVRVHDLTPGNIMLTEDRRVVVTSLGQPLPDNPLTAPAEVLAYTPPERLFGGLVGDDSEVYGLGVLLAHLIFGRLPFEGNPISILAQKQQSESLPPLEDAQLSLACPYPLAAVMHRATTCEPSERYPSVEVFREALLEMLNGHPYKAQPLPYRGPRLGGPARRDDVLPARASLRSYALAPATVTRLAGVRAEGYDEQEAVFRAARVAPQVAPVITVAMPTRAQATVAMPAQAQPAALDAAPEEGWVAPEAGEEWGADGTLPDADEGPAEEITYDPLMPGLNTPALHAALPFTVLVPMPELPEAGQNGGRAPALAQHVLSAHHVVILIVLAILAVTTAMMFG